VTPDLELIVGVGPRQPRPGGVAEPEVLHRQQQRRSVRGRHVAGRRAVSPQQRANLTRSREGGVSRLDRGRSLGTLAEHIEPGRLAQRLQPRPQ